MKKLILMLITGLCACTVQGQGWQELGVGLAGLNANGQIISVVADNAGKVYTSGAFVLNGERDVYQWGTSHWETLGTLGANSWFASLYADAANNIYTGGKFTNAAGNQFVYKWNGAIWLPLGLGINSLSANNTIWGVCTDIAGNVYAGGAFTNSAGSNYVAVWNGITWTELGAGSGALNANSTILSLCADIAGNVYAAGYFTTGSGQCYVAKWNAVTAAWSVLGSGFNGFINRLRCDASGNVYACGGFTNASGNTYVAMYHGTAWAEVGPGAGGLNAAGVIFDMSLGKGGAIYAGGSFVNGSGKQYVAYWNGTAWSELGSTAGPLNANSTIYAVCADTVNNKVYTAGNFTNTNGKYYVAEYDMPATTPGGVGVRHMPGAATQGHIFPNPATDEIVIETGEATAATATLTITDAAGRSVVRKSVAVHTGKIACSMSGLPAGLYIVRAECAGGYTEGQVVKR